MGAAHGVQRVGADQNHLDAALVDFDLPDGAGDVDRWIAQRVLSPAATLHHEATTLLAEDPALAGADPALHHSILGVIASGSVTAGKIASRLGRQVSNLAPALGRHRGCRVRDPA